VGRDVALKVLPQAVANDAQRLARFQREEQVLASLNRPNIAAIYGLEESGKVRALVMELIDGPTLAERIAQGPIPLDEALPLARQIGEGLEYAHEKGDCPPRSEAGERQGDSRRRGKNPGFWSGQGAQSSGFCCRSEPFQLPYH
jgi:serine/threonine protein kinase